MRQALRRICPLLTMLAAISGISSVAPAQSWPQRLVKFVVPLVVGVTFVSVPPPAE